MIIIISVVSIVTVHRDFLLMAQAVRNKHDLKGQHKSSGKCVDTVHGPRVFMYDNIVWIFFP